MPLPTILQNTGKKVVVVISGCGINPPLFGSNTYTTAKLRNYKLNIDQDTTGQLDYFLGLNRPSKSRLRAWQMWKQKPQTIDTF